MLTLHAYTGIQTVHSRMTLTF